MSSGLSIGDLAGKSIAELRALGSGVPHVESQSPLNTIRALLQSYKLTEIHDRLNRYRIDFSRDEFIFEPILPLLKSIGDQVASGDLEVGQEHAISAVIRSHLLATYYNLCDLAEQNLIQKEVFLITTTSGNQHEIGALVAAIICAGQGFRTHYLGPNLPKESILDSYRALGASHIILGLPPIVVTSRRRSTSCIFSWVSSPSQISSG